MSSLTLPIDRSENIIMLAKVYTPVEKEEFCIGDMQEYNGRFCIPLKMLTPTSAKTIATYNLAWKQQQVAVTQLRGKKLVLTLHGKRWHGDTALILSIGKDKLGQNLYCTIKIDDLDSVDDEGYAKLWASRNVKTSGEILPAREEEFKEEAPRSPPPALLVPPTPIIPRSIPAARSPGKPIEPSATPPAPKPDCCIIA